MNTKVFCLMPKRVYFGIRPKHLFFGEWKHRRKQENPKIYDKRRELGTVCRSVTSFSSPSRFLEFLWLLRRCHDKSRERIKSKSDQTSLLFHILSQNTSEQRQHCCHPASRKPKWISKINFESISEIDLHNFFLSSNRCVPLKQTFPLRSYRFRAV